MEYITIEDNLDNRDILLNFMTTEQINDECCFAEGELDLINIGISKIENLKGKNPDILYEKLNKITGNRVDRCMLYTFRCAVYYASNKVHDPKLLKWWNWK